MIDQFQLLDLAARLEASKRRQKRWWRLKIVGAVIVAVIFYVMD